MTEGRDPFLPTRQRRREASRCGALEGSIGRHISVMEETHSAPSCRHPSALVILAQLADVATSHQRKSTNVRETGILCR